MIDNLRILCQFICTGTMGEAIPNAVKQHLRIDDLCPGYKKVEKMIILLSYSLIKMNNIS